MSNETISCSLSTGVTVPFRRYQTKKGPFAYGIMPKGETSPKAVKVSPSVLGLDSCGTDFPSHVTILGVRMEAKVGTTDEKRAKSSGGKLGRITTPAGLPKVSYSGIITVDGESKRATLWAHDYGTHFKLGGGIITAVGGQSSVVHDSL